MLGVHSQDAVHILLTQCPDLSKLEPSVVMARLCKLKVGYTYLMLSVDMLQV